MRLYTHIPAGSSWCSKMAMTLAAMTLVSSWSATAFAQASTSTIQLPDWPMVSEVTFITGIAPDSGDVTNVHMELTFVTDGVFDASDLMPPSVGSGTFWNEIVNWIAADGADTETYLQAIDDSWPS